MDGISMCVEAMQASQRQLEVAAGNLANVETDGFHHALQGAERGGGTLAGRAAPLRPTGKPFDLVVTRGALHVAPRRGDGYALDRMVAVRGASFHRGADGALVDERGRALVGRAGVVRVDDGVTIRPDGTFVQDGRDVARVAVTHGAELRSGFVEGSDVNPIGEMIAVLDAQRSFETAQKTLSAVDAARQKATSDVGTLK